ncbi:MAG TPA: MarR family transcriptional regulator [Nitrospirota bacterium]|jgi:DNA-binding MarR family transcriptional regulator
MDYNIEDSVGFLIAKCYQRGYGIFREKLEPYHITPPQFSILAFLWKEDGQSQAELSEHSQIDRTTIVGLIDRLERDGLVERHQHDTDRRANRIMLTQKGRALEGELPPIALEVTTEFAKNISGQDIADLRRILHKLRR